MRSWRWSAGVVAGAAAWTVAVGVAAERYAMTRLRGGLDPDVIQRFHESRGRQLTVPADDGVPLYVEVDGDVNDYGDAEVTIVFCHGWTLQHASWYYQREDLGDLGRLVFWDQCDHGKSGRSERGDVSIEATAEDLRAVLDAVAPHGPVVLVGHSMGGMTILALADRYPELFGERVVGVALISTVASGLGGLVSGAYGTLVRTLAPALFRRIRGKVKAVERIRAMGRAISWVSTERLACGPEAGPDLVAVMDGMISATPIDVVASYYPAILDHDKRSALEVLGRVPTLVIAGAEDKLVPAEASRVMARDLPDAELVEIPGAGHIVMLERPEAVNDALRALVKKARPVADLESTP